MNPPRLIFTFKQQASGESLFTLHALCINSFILAVTVLYSKQRSFASAAKMVDLEKKMHFIVEAKYVVIIFIVDNNSQFALLCHFQWQPSHLYNQCLCSQPCLCIEAIYAHKSLCKYETLPLWVSALDCMLYIALHQRDWLCAVNTFKHEQTCFNQSQRHFFIHCGLCFCWWENNVDVVLLIFTTKPIG